MDYLLIAVVALLASVLTFFSGFGLGTILTPFFILFFPVDVAILMTAIVHLLNNLFKAFLVGKYLAWNYMIFFGGGALLGAIGGAYLLGMLESADRIIDLGSYGIDWRISLLKFSIGGLIFLFAILELLPELSFRNSSKGFLVFGGSLSGFFGGVSGHQGALRSAFLAKTGLTKEAFIATGIGIALVVDIARIPIYLGNQSLNANQAGFLVTGVLAAFIGAIIGKRFLKKIKMASIQWIVGLFMMAIGLLLMFNLI